MVRIKNSYFELLANNKKLIDVLKEKEFTTSISYWLNKGFSQAITESENYFSEKMKIINRYAKKDENNKPIVDSLGGITIENENINTVTTELNTLLSIELELPNLKIVDINYEDPTLPKLSGKEQDIMAPFVNDITGK